MTNPVSDRDREHLSALRHGRLSVQETNDLERKIAGSPDLSKEWQQLRHLRMLMKELPRHKVRRGSFSENRVSFRSESPLHSYFPCAWQPGWPPPRW